MPGNEGVFTIEHGILEPKLDDIVKKAVAVVTKTLHDEFTKLFDSLKERMVTVEKRMDAMDNALPLSQTELIKMKSDWTILNYV